MGNLQLNEQYLDKIGVNYIYFMYTFFLYWHTYYDAAFLKETIRVSPALLEELNISSEIKMTWPSLKKLTQLLSCFEIFQQFILNKSNWIGSCCTLNQLEIIQREVNYILILLQCQKKYGNDFWQVEIRRIQASVIHFILILKQFFFAILPKDCNSILKAKQMQKLCIKTEQIESLVNSILKYMGPIYQFMLGQQFREELPLTEQFFQHFNQITKFLPKVPKEKLLLKERLVEYIRIINSLEVEDQAYQKKQLRREKSQTMNKLSKPSKNDENLIDLLDQKNKPGVKQFVRIQIDVNSQKQYPDIFSPSKSSPKISKPLFTFTENVRKISIYNLRNMNHEVQSIHAEPTSGETSPFSRLLNHDFSPEKQNRGLAQSMIVENRSPQSTAYKPRQTSPSAHSDLSRLTKNQQKKYIMEKDQDEGERDGKNKKKRVIKMSGVSQKYSNKINISDGKTKGWGIIRQHVSRIIAEVKVKNLLKF